MSDENNWLEWGFKGAIGLLGLAGGLIMNDQKQKIKEIDDKAEDAIKDGRALENYVYKQTYTKDEVNAMIRETKDTVKRIYEVVDRLDSKIEARNGRA